MANTMTTSGVTLGAGDSLSIPDRQEKKVRIAVRAPAHKLCRHCDGRVPFFRALLHTEFCTTAHEREYRKQIEDLGIERLREAAKRLRIAAGRPAEASLDDATVA